MLKGVACCMALVKYFHDCSSVTKISLGSTVKKTSGPFALCCMQMILRSTQPADECGPSVSKLQLFENVAARFLTKTELKSLRWPSVNERNEFKIILHVY